MKILNLAEICPRTQTLGPGQRFVIWVQGCCFNCGDCIAPEWIEQKQSNLVDPLKLGDYLISQKDLDGLTVSGGEPMLQAEALSELFTHIRSKSDFSIICYSGFTLEQLKAQSDFYVDQVLSLIDVLIDGQYVSQLNDDKGIRGSSNQTVHFLTSRHIQEKHLFEDKKRNVEIHLQAKEALIVGVPPKNIPHLQSLP